MNVVDVERDAKLFRALTARLVSESASAEKALRQQCEEEKQIALLTVLAAKFTKLNPVVNAHFGGGDEDVEAEEVVPSQRSPPETAAVLVTACPACGKDVKSNDGVACGVGGRLARKVHGECAVRCGACASGFCSDSCKKAHECKKSLV